MENPPFADIRARWEEFGSAYCILTLVLHFVNYIMWTKRYPFPSDPTYI